MVKTKHLPDRQLINLMHKKNQLAFLEAYDRYSAPLYGVISKMVKNEEQAAEVLKVSFERMWHESQSLSQHQGRLFIWMHNITRDVIIEQINKSIMEESYHQQLNRTGSYMA